MTARLSRPEAWCLLLLAASTLLLATGRRLTRHNRTGDNR